MKVSWQSVRKLLAPVQIHIRMDFASIFPKTYFGKPTYLRPKLLILHASIYLAPLVDETTAGFGELCYDLRMRPGSKWFNPLFPNARISASWKSLRKTTRFKNNVFSVKPSVRSFYDKLKQKQLLNHLSFHN